MRCVNQNGGYLCLPRGLYTQQYTPDYQVQQEPFYPDTSDGVPDTFPPSRPRSAEPSYPIMRTSAQCVLGYALAEDGTCSGELTFDLWGGCRDDRNGRKSSLLVRVVVALHPPPWDSPPISTNNRKLELEGNQAALQLRQGGCLGRAPLSPGSGGRGIPVVVSVAGLGCRHLLMTSALSDPNAKNSISIRFSCTLQLRREGGSQMRAGTSLRPLMLFPRSSSGASSLWISAGMSDVLPLLQLLGPCESRLTRR